MSGQRFSSIVHESALLISKDGYREQLTQSVEKVHVVCVRSAEWTRCCHSSVYLMGRLSTKSLRQTRVELPVGRGYVGRCRAQKDHVIVQTVSEYTSQRQDDGREQKELLHRRRLYSWLGKEGFELDDSVVVLRKQHLGQESTTVPCLFMYGRSCCLLLVLISATSDEVQDNVATLLMT